MSQIASLYKNASMLSEDPSGDWIVRGIRGVKTYILMAIRSINDEDINSKNNYVQKASDLLFFLQGIVVDDGENSLGQRISALYTNFQVNLTKAHAENSVSQLRHLVQELMTLETDMKKILINV
jgi:flagellar biosynthetic protein FliS